MLSVYYRFLLVLLADNLRYIAPQTLAEEEYGVNVFKLATSEFFLDDGEQPISLIGNILVQSGGSYG
jgi:hypothetical protein